MEALQLTYELDKLGDIVEERRRLIDVLKIEPSSHDNVNLKKQLNKTLDLLNETGGSRLEGWDELATKYNDLLEDLQDDSLDLKLYHFSGPKVHATPEGSSITSSPSMSRDLTKKVRFKDEDLVTYEDDAQQMQPYRDEPELPASEPQDMEQERQLLFDSPEILEETDTVVPPQVSNQEVFIQQQQQLLEQDSHLERLSGSVRTTHDISLRINEEVTEQNEQVLHDLESLVDNGGRNLDRAKRRLTSFEKSAKENGPCFVIVVLVLILILLLAVM